MIKQRAFSPKPRDPGQGVTWTRENVTRTGEIWADGPLPRSVWVRPDDDQSVIVGVIFPTPLRASRGDQPAQLYPDWWAGRTTARVENVRRHGTPYPVIERTEAHYDYRYGAQRTRNVLSWHVDPECRRAAGKEREDTAGIWPVWTERDVIDIVTGVRDATGTKTCGACIFLDAAA